MKRIVLFTVVFFCLSSTYAFTKGFDEFKLISQCRPISLLVGEGQFEDIAKMMGGGWPQDAQKIGLSPKSVRNVAESRLRSARIYGSEDPLSSGINPLLYITLDTHQVRAKSGYVLGTFFLVDVTFQKAVVDFFDYLRISGAKKLEFPPPRVSSGMATTWKRSFIAVTGAHDKNPEFILSKLSRIMDEFLVEYLRVNDEACRKKK